jgi:hypothetical protein
LNLEINNETIRLCEVVSKERRNKIVEGDMIVPDIKPDILSVSNVDADVFLTKKEVSDGKILIEGVIDATAMYVAEDQSCSNKSLNNIFSFSEVIEIENLTSESIVNVETTKESIEYKVINGRKLTVRISITLNVEVRNCCEYTIAKDVVDDRTVEIQREEIEVQSLLDSQIQNIELNEIINLPEENKSIAEILKANLDIKNVDYKTSYNKILAKADAVVKIIYVSDSEIPTLEIFEASVPVMGYINSDNLDEKTKIELQFNIKSFALRPIYQDLKSRSFSIESEIEVRADVYQSKKIEIISDIYDPDATLNLQTQDINVTNKLIDVNENIEIIQSLMIPELENIKILSINVDPIITNKNVLEGKIAIEGNGEFTILYYNEQKRIIESKKLDLPYQQVLKIPELKSNMEANILLSVRELEYRKVDSNELQIKVIFDVKVIADETKLIQGITKIDVYEISDEKRPSVIVYYVKPNDTLWNIAKKYRITIRELKEYNEIKEDKIYPNQQLIIPKRNKKLLTELG